MRFAPFFCLIATSTVGCAVDATPEDETADSADAVTYGDYHTLRPDLRRCMSPICGGYWVKRVNREHTVCADGTLAPECYVATLDLHTKLGLTDGELAGVGLTTLVLRGRVSRQTIGSFEIGGFVATEAWYPGTDATPKGTLYRVTDLGIRCVKAPCFSLEAQKLNFSTVTKLSGLDSAAANSALGGGPILVAGTTKVVTFPAGSGKSLEVSSFYTRLAHKVGACDSDAQCTSSPYRGEVSSAADCYCRICPSSVIDTFTAADREADWTRLCSKTKLICPAVKCMAPAPVGCVAGRCQAL